jgi:hypothetical protein
MAGSVTVSKYLLSQDKRTLVIKLACVGDSSDGSVPDTQITGAALGDMFDDQYEIDYTRAGFSLKEVWAVVGATAPDAADVTVKDAIGCELYTEVGVIPASGTKAGSVTARLVTSNLTVVVENQDTASATYDIYLKLSR